MFKNILIFALASLVIVGVQGEQGSNGSDIVSAVAKPEGNGIKATIKFSKPSDGFGLQVTVDAEGLSVGTKYPYHIHVSPVPSDGNCTATGGHLDPFKIKVDEDSYKCDARSPSETCELGDLAGRHGSIVPNSDGKFSTSYLDQLISFTGDSTILEHSVVIHGTDNVRLACANIIASTEGSEPKPEPPKCAPHKN